MSEKEIKKAIINVTYEALAGFLELPEEHHVINVISDGNSMRHQSIQVIITGPKWPSTFEGMELPWIFSLNGETDVRTERE